MKTTKLTLLIIFFIAVYNNQSQAQNNYTTQCNVLSGTTTQTLTFQLFVPNVDTIRGIYFYLSGGSMNSYNVPASNSIYRDLATKHKFALMGANLLGETIFAYYYPVINGYLADSVYKMVDNFALLSGHTELHNAPFFLEGHSNGGSFCYNFSMYKSDRVIGFIDQEGCAINAVIPAKGLSVPSYTLAGANDGTQPVNHTFVGFINNRLFGAPWGFAISPTAGHTRNNDTSLLFPYFREIVKLRLPEKLTIGSQVPLQAIDKSKGWLGDNQSFLIGPDSCFYLDKKYASWFPSMAIAQKWQKFVSGNSINSIAQCGADSIQQPGYFGQKAPGDIPVVFAPGLISVRGRSEFRFEMSADSSQAGFTSYARSNTTPLDLFMTHFFYDTTKYQRMFKRNGKWTYPSHQPKGIFLAGYSTDMKNIFYRNVKSTQIASSLVSDENFQVGTAIALNIPNVVYPSFTKSGKMYINNYADSVIYRAEKMGNTYGSPVLLPITGAQFPFVSPDETYIIFEKKGDLYVCFNDGIKWSDPITLGTSVNTSFIETCPTISADGKYIFFSRADEPSGFRTWDTEKLNISNIYWVSTSVIAKAKLISNIAYSTKKNNVSLSPNPATNYLNLSNMPQDATIFIYSIDGKLYKQQKIETSKGTIEISNLSKGVYLLNINSKEGNDLQKFIKQ